MFTVKRFRWALESTSTSPRQIVTEAAGQRVTSCLASGPHGGKRANTVNYIGH